MTSKTVLQFVTFQIILTLAVIPLGCTVSSDDGNGKDPQKAAAEDKAKEAEDSANAAEKKEMAEALEAAEEELNQTQAEEAEKPQEPEEVSSELKEALDAAIANLDLPEASDLSLHWIHDENVDGPETYEHHHEYLAKSKNKARLILTNNGQNELPSSGWAIYFRIGPFMYLDEDAFDQDNESVEVGFVGIQGRYKIVPNDRFQPLKTGESMTIPIVGMRQIMLNSDPPVGFYLVSVDENGKEALIGDIAITYSEIKGFNPSPDPIGARATAASRYARHAQYYSEAEPQLSLPKPRSANVDDSQKFAVAKLGAVSAAEELKFESETLTALLDEHRQTAEGDDALAVKLAVDGGLAAEEYQLAINGEGVSITGGSAAGVFYGVQTFSQLLDRFGDELPAIKIEDQPHFSYRGLMVDICRHYFGPETLEKVIDQMAHYKMNILQLHLNDDEAWRIEIPSLPELTEIGSKRGHVTHDANGKVVQLPVVLNDGGTGPSGYLTRDEYIDLVKYAAARHIEVIPEIDVPGHSRSAIQALKDKPGYLLIDPEDSSVHESPQGFRDNILNPAMEGVYPFLEQVFTSIGEMHEAAGVPLKHVHIGGDEAPHEAWTRSPAIKKAGYDNIDPKVDPEKALELHQKIRDDFSQKLYGIIDKASSDKVLIGSWHENSPYITERLANGKAYVTEWDFDGAATYERLKKGQPTVLSNPRQSYWDMAYENNPTERGHFWSGFTDTKEVFEYRPLALTDEPLPEKELQLIIGVQAQIWTETINNPEMLQWYMMPRMLPFAERAWNPDVSAEDIEATWPEFAAYMGYYALPRLEQDGFLFRVPKPGAINDNGKLKAIVPYPNLAIRYTTDGSEPTAESALYDPENPPEFDAAMKLRTFTPGGRESSVVPVEE